MRVPLNLASQSRENLRPVRTALIVAALVAVVLGALILNREWRNRNEFRELIRQQAALEFSLRDLETQQNEMESALSTQEAQQIRDRSAFMNSLILRKSLSWTQLFMDLEKTLPGRARITAIHPRLNKAEDVDLDLTIAAASTETLVEFLKNLESSTEFGSPAVGSQHYSTDTSSETEIELVLTTRYVQNRARNLPANTAASVSPSPANQIATFAEKDMHDQETPEEEMLEEEMLEEEMLEEEMPEEEME